MNSEQKFPSRIDPAERQRFVASANLMIAMLEKANLAGSFTLKEAGEIIQAISVVTQFVNVTLPL